MTSDSLAVSVTALPPNTTTTTNSTTPAASSRKNNQHMEIVSSLVVVAVFVFVCGISYLIYRKICRSPHRSRRHGLDGENGQVKGKRQYYDQFGVDTNDLTVNSVTAIKWDEDEKHPWNSALSGSRSSGIECDVSDEPRNVQRINTGKRVFQVNKVSENSPRPAPGGQHVVIRLHKGFADAARSLQASDGNNFTLALIDKNSKTIHNINLHDSSRGRAPARSPLAGEGRPSPKKVRRSPAKSRRLNSERDANGQTSTSSYDGMIHDSPDFGRKNHPGVSDEVTAGSISLSDESGTNEEKETCSVSLSSNEPADNIDNAATRLLHLTTDAHTEPGPSNAGGDNRQLPSKP